MSAITIDNELVHYEVLGRGRPVILLHSWLGSWRYWVPAMQQLSMKFRTYALDFWGFGDSGKGSNRYEFAAQVNMLELFIEELGIKKAALIGHGLGAAVAVAYAQKNPDRVPRLMVVSPPLFRMAPTSLPLTHNAPPQLPPNTPASAGAAANVSTPVTITSPTGTPPAGATPVTPPPGGPTPPAPPSNPALELAAGTESPTMPTKPDELKDAIRAVMEQRARALGEQIMAEKSPLSPRDAATPPTDKPAKEITTSEMQALPQQYAAAAAAAAALSGEIQAANPLKDHLGTLERLALLKKHVDAGANFDKLKAEVEKADTAAISGSIESMGNVDILKSMIALPMPCVAVYGTKDTFLPPPDESMLTELKNSQGLFHPIPMDDLRHFPMLESVPEFTRLTTSFLTVPAAELASLVVDETWKRRVR